MPTPSTAKWPKPKSEDEFEDIVVDALRIRWKDPNATRNGRRGQRQHGVDIYGRPPWLKGKLAAAQCKNTEALTLDVVIAEAGKALGFSDELREFFVVTSADRDVELQAQVREHFAGTGTPFRVEVLFWLDITADISTDDALVAKHWKGFAEGAASSTSPSRPVRRIDRTAGQVDQTAEWECEFALWLGPSNSPLNVSELTTELHSENTSHGMIRALLEEPAVREASSVRWSSAYRHAANVTKNWEVEVRENGFLAYRWGESRTGDLRLFDVDRLFDGVVQTLRTHRAAIEHAAKKFGTSLPSTLTARLCANGSGPHTLYDESGLTRPRGIGYASTAEWTVLLHLEWNATLRAKFTRILNQALFNFSPDQDRNVEPILGRPAAYPQLDEEALTSVLRRIGLEPN